MYLGYKGLRNVLTYSHDAVFILAFLGYIVVGLGSMAFHATLKCLAASRHSRVLFPGTPVDPLFHRLDATGRRTADDLYGMYHVVRCVLVW
jgi:hypothetical protein